MPDATYGEHNNHWQAVIAQTRQLGVEADQLKQQWQTITKEPPMPDATDRDSFLRAIIATPDADLPRLVYADWLDEHGEGERAEFIRVQCELTATPKPYPPCCDVNGKTISSATPPMKIIDCGCDWSFLRDRERELLERHEPKWTAEIFQMHAFRPRLAHHADVLGTYHRGFIEVLCCSWEIFAAYYEQWRTRTPLRRVELTTSPGSPHPHADYPGIDFHVMDGHWGVTLHDSTWTLTT